MTASKNTIRQEARRHRVRINPLEDHPDGAADIFMQAINPQSGQIIASYWPMGREFDPAAIVDACLAAGLQCALPVVQENNRVLKFALWTPQHDMEKGAFEIPQPAQKDFVEPDIIMAPLLAFDRRGYRLGQGGGYYDATLADYRSRRDILAVGVGYSQQAVLFNLPIEDHDEKLDWVITPTGAHDFRE